MQLTILLYAPSILELRLKVWLEVSIKSQGNTWGLRPTFMSPRLDK